MRHSSDLGQDSTEDIFGVIIRIFESQGKWANCNGIEV